MDCWAVGVLAYELLTGLTPFGGKTREATHFNIISNEPIFENSSSPCPSSSIRRAVPQGAQDFIRAVLAPYRFLVPTLYRAIPRL